MWIRPFTKKTYQQRRRNLVQALQKKNQSFTCLFFSGREKVRNFDCHFPFRATSDFLYLTGFEEPESLLLLESHKGKVSLLIGLRPKDSSKNRGSELWEGVRLGVKAAPTVLGVTSSFDVHDAKNIVAKSLAKTNHLFWTLGEDSSWDQDLIEMIARTNATSKKAAGVTATSDPKADLQELRKVKSKEEVDIMRKSALIASKAHIRAMQFIRPGQYEYQVQGEVEHTFLMEGATGPAYNTIAATGNNACTLHYTASNSKIKHDELFLLDAGAEWGGYASDITRTFPANGKFSPAQKEVYEWVLKSQRASIGAIKAGVPWNRPHEVATNVLIQALIRLRVLKGSVASNKKSQKYKDYFPHGTSHWLGLDVHDAGTYLDKNEKPIKLKAGNILTVEPGLYFRKDDRSVPARLRGMGIRIEDDVLVTRTGHDVLTKYCPKTVKEIEALRA